MNPASIDKASVLVKKTRDFLMENTVAYELRVEKENVPQPTPPNITDPN